MVQGQAAASRVTLLSGKIHTIVPRQDRSAALGRGGYAKRSDDQRSACALAGFFSPLAVDRRESTSSGIRSARAADLDARDWAGCEVLCVEDDHLAGVVRVQVGDEGDYIAVVFVLGADSRSERGFGSVRPGPNRYFSELPRSVSYFTSPS